MLLQISCVTETPNAMFPNHPTCNIDNLGLRDETKNILADMDHYVLAQHLHKLT